MLNEAQRERAEALADKMIEAGDSPAECRENLIKMYEYAAEECMDKRKFDQMMEAPLKVSKDGLQVSYAWIDEAPYVGPGFTYDPKIHGPINTNWISPAQVKPGSLVMIDADGFKTLAEKPSLWQRFWLSVRRWWIRRAMRRAMIAFQRKRGLR